jgi:hypothetical protein
MWQMAKDFREAMHSHQAGVPFPGLPELFHPAEHMQY